jgi:RNA polymerase sigma-70 factor (ECF subfamily)
VSCRERHDQSDISRDDGLLIRDAMAGNRDAFAALFDRHYELIYCIAYRLTRNPTDAEDIAQETCLKLARKLNSYRFEARFTAWLYRLTLNTAKDWCRKAYRTRERAWPEDCDVSGADPSPERCAVTREF